VKLVHVQCVYRCLYVKLVHVTFLENSLASLVFRRQGLILLTSTAIFRIPVQSYILSNDGLKRSS
jgi:hypothetical protein